MYYECTTNVLRSYKHPNSLKMHVFKIKLLEFFNELLFLFEDKNKIVYRRIIHYRHHVRNKLEEDDLYSMAIDFLSQESVRGMIASNNHMIMKGTPLEMDVDLLWESCTPKNKAIIWKWIDVIVETIEPCLV
jgi:hypothetical protein